MNFKNDSNCHTEQKLHTVSGEEIQEPYCRFCDKEKRGVTIAEKGTVFCLEDSYPVTADHLLIIPHRHTLDYFTMTARERRDAEDLIIQMRNKITQEDPSVVGFNVGVNCGRPAGQSIMHAHIHLIPRRIGDTPYPRGGVRGVIPCSRRYKHGLK
ncbi:MAG: HIT family protein [Desulfotomaculaceae bacterium]|nr:HIT family protein [Desulfotomaculaceae bacterium]